MQLKLWRGVDPSSNTLSKGAVDAKYIKRKLSKQLRIDLEPHESVRLHPEPVHHAELDQKPGELQALLEAMPAEGPCTAQVRQLGEYVACLGLRGGYRIPLRVEVSKR